MALSLSITCPSCSLFIPSPVSATMLPLFLLLHVFTHTFSASAAASSLPFDAAALLAFKSKSDLGNRLRFFVNRSSFYDTHCSWPGVQCSSESKVTRLVLEGYGLNGSFANGTLGRLDQLRILSLKGNSLTGPVPDLSGLVNLKALFLGHNKFAGPFPASIFSLHRLRTLDLSHNNFTGPLPSNINSLDRLYCLRLESNLFKGSIPPLNQTTLRIFNVSKNELTGAIPVTDTLSAFDASAFSENPGLCGEVVRRECHSHLFFFHGGPGSNSMAPAPAAAAVKGGQLDDQGFRLPGSSSGSSGSSALKFRRRAAIALGFLAGAFLVIGFVTVLIVMKNNRRRMRQGKILSPEKNSEVLVESNIIENSSNVINPIDQIENSNNELVTATEMSEEKVKKLGKSGCLVFCAGEAQVYTLEQLMRASAEMLGRGSVGSTYKAVLDNRLIVSVKRLDAMKMGPTGKEAFERHMDAVGRLRHPNLIPLRAYFQAKEERLLVYDYQLNGSLFSLIHGSRSTRAKPLHWTSCLKIAEDVAQGLAYIHQASRLVHGNLKSSNVLLGADFEACLTDYCLLSLVEPSDGEDESGYQAPEIRKSIHQLTPRSDIYSFGVLLLELLTGKPPLQHTALIATDLPAWVRAVREDEGTDDERIMMIVDVAVFCVRSPPESRPTTYQVLKLIQEVKETDTEDHDNESSFVP